jgi:hypothetical protein
VTEPTVPKAKEKKRQAIWLVYLAALVAGAILLADALNYELIQRLTARLGLALLFSAIALFVANGRPAGWIATAILWVAVILTFFV